MECEQMGDRTVPDDNDQRMAGQFRASAPFLLHERTRFIRSEARADRQSGRDLGGVLQGKTSCYSDDAASDYARELVRVAGPERLVWASDCPFVGCEQQVRYQDTIDWLIDCVPDQAARRKIFGETALKLYFG